MTRERFRLATRVEVVLQVLPPIQTRLMSLAEGHELFILVDGRCLRFWNQDEFYKA